MTKELLLLQQYSKLVEKIEAENKVLRELLVKKQNNYILMYNSRERYKAQYDRLASKVQGLPEYLGLSKIC